MYVCLSLCPHVSARFPLDGFSLNLMLGTSVKICRESTNLDKIGLYFYEDLSLFRVVGSDYVVQKYMERIVAFPWQRVQCPLQKKKNVV